MPENLTDYEEARLLDLSLTANDKIALCTVAGTDAALGTEVTGGSYARAAATFGAAVTASGVTTKTLSAPSLFLNMPAVDVQGWAIMDNASGGNRKWYGLFQDRVVVASATADNLTKAAHGLTNGQKVVFQSGYTPAGLTANVTYFVVAATTDAFQVASTSGGAALDITADSTNSVVGKVITAAAGEVLAIQAGSLQVSLA